MSLLADAVSVAKLKRGHIDERMNMYRKHFLSFETLFASHGLKPLSTSLATDLDDIVSNHLESDKFRRDMAMILDLEPYINRIKELETELSRIMLLYNMYELPD
jgi:hypothetical protein